MKKSREERKKTILALMNDKHYVPMKEKELAVIMQVAPEDRPELSSILEELMLTGKIEANKRGKYSIAGTQDDTEKYPDSKVDIEKLKNWDINHIVGTYDKSNKSFGFVVPDNAKLSTDIYVKVEDSMGAVSGHKVVCELTNYGDRRHSPEGRIVEILGHVNDPGVDIMSIVKGFGLPMEYPDDVMRQTAGCADDVSEEETVGREDLRDVLMVTIDGEDSKDLDDAVSLTCTDDEYELGVHIADVSHYVREGSPLDKEALKRGTSVYLIDRVIPMLPHKLSNGICSLNEGEDRLALSCIMTIDRTGDVKNYRIVESVINVNHRMTYTSVNKMIYLKDEAERAEYADVADMLDHMYELSQIIRKSREKRGSIDFDLQETKIILDAEGHPVDIHPYERNAATKLIEDFMLMANQTVAEHFEHLKIPFV
ncbi:MAG: VacB/RNase II family 3'-5' exoribonuclease, partial [Lachnospiraceae bacterium]|nr:VacB/RNase II family 3'-5' exoribonuclease [Lachnospiraceae bacterium]